MLGPSEPKEEVKELQSVQQEQVKQEQKAKEIEKFQEERLNSIEFSLADTKASLTDL